MGNAQDRFLGINQGSSRQPINLILNLLLHRYQTSQTLLEQHYRRITKKISLINPIVLSSRQLVNKLGRLFDHQFLVLLFLRSKYGIKFLKSQFPIKILIILLNDEFALDVRSQNPQIVKSLFQVQITDPADRVLIEDSESDG